MHVQVPFWLSLGSQHRSCSPMPRFPPKIYLLPLPHLGPACRHSPPSAASYQIGRDAQIPSSKPSAASCRRLASAPRHVLWMDRLCFSTVRRSSNIFTIPLSSPACYRDCAPLYTCSFLTRDHLSIRFILRFRPLKRDQHTNIALW